MAAVTRVRRPTTVSRPNPVPDALAPVTLNLIGDTHVGGLPTYRLDALITDMRSGRIPTPTAHIQLGDQVNDNQPAMWTTFKEFRARLPRTSYLAMGNHDQGFPTANLTPDQWAATAGAPAPNYTFDVGPVRVIVISDNIASTGATGQITTATLTWLDQQLTAAGSKPCFIACHYPIWDTVASSSSTTLEYTSKTSTFYISTAATPGSSADVLAVLSAHTNVKAWLSGHTHSRITVPGLVMPFVAGSQRIAHVNASCIWYCGKKTTNFSAPDDPVHTCYATWFGDHLEVRYRHHITGQWYGPEGRRVMTVTGL